MQVVSDMQVASGMQVVNRQLTFRCLPYLSEDHINHHLAKGRLQTTDQELCRRKTK